MKLRWTIVLTVGLLFLTLGAAAMSAVWGFSIGRAALQGVTQPDVRPSSHTLGRGESVVQSDNVEFLREEDILKQVDAQIADPNRALGANN